MMALAFKTKAEAKRALAERGTLGPDDVIETSFFGPEYRDGKTAVVVSVAPDRVRNSFAEITISGGRIVAIR
jgi:hypothetical protein